jgi:hypothetical protein
MAREGGGMIVSVIIVGLNEWERYTKPCIYTLQTNERQARIIVVDNGSVAEAQARASALGYTYDPSQERWELGLYSVKVETFLIRGGGAGRYNKVCRFVSQSSAVPPAQIRLAVESGMAPIAAFRLTFSGPQSLQWEANSIDPVSGRYNGAPQCTRQSTMVTVETGPTLAPRFSVLADLEGCTAEP